MGQTLHCHFMMGLVWDIRAIRPLDLSNSPWSTQDHGRSGKDEWEGLSEVVCEPILGCFRTHAFFFL